MTIAQPIDEYPIKTIILDDDPTGTQTVSGVSVILKPTAVAIRHQFSTPDWQAVYILTNSRSMPRDAAVQLVQRIKTDAEQAARETGARIRFLLRGDSTLRGHIFAEMEALGGEETAALFVPAFPECGRITRAGVHYLLSGITLTPVVKTEFAQDPVFGYGSEGLTDWVAEVSGGGWSASLVPLEQIRSADGPGAVCQALLDAKSGTVVIPDAETYADLKRIAEGLRLAEAAGKQLVIRSAASFAAVRSGLQPLSLERAEMSGAGRLLVVCGSHTSASTRQLELLAQRTGATPILVPTHRLLQEEGDAVVRETAERVADKLRFDRFSIIASERVRLQEHSDLAIGSRVMQAIASIVALVAPECDGVISKGGITSAEVASEGLGADTAYVRGQLESGISLWDIRTRDGRSIPYGVVPGNIGDDAALLRIVSKFDRKLTGGG
ncbi:four-carbon acid sugar kinase family protein [Paenibacillus cymbidii]|uniref:four-carbon acid sugar kinase family protein n=1 Tax=Paenibacillus cymbidii TaxID=1639034 RepID=UPI0014368375|nr:four-carbon acid sugar kinase family protein [Paenibacillus cymbidii]